MKQWRIVVRTESGDVTPHGWTDVKADRDGDGRPDRAQEAARRYGQAGVWDGLTHIPGHRVQSVVVEMRDAPKPEPAKPAPKPAAAAKPKPKRKPRAKS